MNVKPWMRSHRLRVLLRFWCGKINVDEAAVQCQRRQANANWYASKSLADLTHAVRAGTEKSLRCIMRRFAPRAAEIVFKICGVSRCKLQDGMNNVGSMLRTAAHNEA